MKTSIYKALYLPYDDIRIKAKEFLEKYNQDFTIPVPIEEIVEFKLDIAVVPCEELQEKIEVEGYISCNLKEIYIDKKIYDTRETRARFTIAHEIGHAILHRDLYDKAKFFTLQEWKDFIDSIDANQYGFLELHANNFAGLILVPSDPLHAKIKEGIRLLEESGFDPNDIHSTSASFDYLSHWIAKKFNVSANVIKKRIERDNLFT
jgi:Zn-dependent peptidase ImmA (M78 family)